MSSVKPCRTCGVLKSRALFSRDRSAKDGLCWSCKDCRRVAAKRQYEANKDVVLANQEVRYAKNPEAKTSANKRYRASAKGQLTSAQGKADYKKRHLIRIAAKAAVQAAVLSGKLHKQPCAACGSDLVEGHHPDYSKPLQVEWLCRKHHAAVHAAFRRKPAPTKVAA